MEQNILAGNQVNVALHYAKVAVMVVSPHLCMVVNHIKT